MVEGGRGIGTTLRWLDLALNDNLYTGAQQSELAISGLGNSNRSSKFKEELTEIMRQNRPFVPTKANRDGFVYAVKKVNDAPKTGEKVVAAKFLATFAPFEPAQILELERLLAGQKDEDVANGIRALLRTAKQ